MAEHDDGSSQDGHVRHEATVQAVEDPVFVVDPEWRLTYANDNALSRAGATFEELVGRPIMALTEEIVVGDGVERFEAELEAVFADEGEFPRTVTLELDLPTFVFG